MTRPSSLADLASIYDSQPISGMRNRIINGDMRIDQRNAGAAVSTHAAFTIDRWRMSFVGGGVYSAQQSSVAPAGFTNSLLMTVTTPDTSIAASDWYRFTQVIEGFNAADLNWGASPAQTVVLSFWVRSSVTGTYCVGLQNDGTNRSYSAEYVISAANTWEYKTVTIAGDTTGTWLKDNGRGISIHFDLGSGSDWNIPVNTWSGSNDWKTSNQTSWIATNGATFHITGVQFEAGAFATPFERRSFGQELLLCQRYFYRNNALTYFAGGSGNSNVARGAAKFGVTMRATPTVVVNGASNLSGTNGLAYVSNTNGTTPINIIDTITVDGFDTIGNTGGLPSTSFLYAVSFTAAAEL